MIQLRALAFGPFAEVEPLNPAFTPSHPKLRLVVDGDPNPEVSDEQLQAELERTFPGIARHQCRDHQDGQEGRREKRGVILLDGESAANQAHLLEHLLLEILNLVDHSSRLSGITCAYESPRHRNDVFVECLEPELGKFVSHVAIDAMNAALAKEALSPLYPDAVCCVRTLLHTNGNRAWCSSDLAPEAGIPAPRAESVLGLFERAGVAQLEWYAVNLSGETFYRLIWTS